MTQATAAPRGNPAIARTMFEGVALVDHSYASVASVGNAATAIVFAALKPCTTFIAARRDMLTSAAIAAPA